MFCLIFLLYYIIVKLFISHNTKFYYFEIYDMKNGESLEQLI